MALVLDEKRLDILKAAGHLLVLGGPGAGKTTIALLKAQRRCAALQPGQEILFLSFSRAAVRQILTTTKHVLTAKERQLIQVQTYHAFCLDMLQSFGRMLTGKHVRIIAPPAERIKKAEFTDGNWVDETHRLASEEGEYCFDRFAGGVATLFEKHQMVRDLIAEKYPLVIVDEFQDTDDDQWRMVKSLAHATTLFCLADPDQRIFEYRGNVDPKRIDMLRQTCAPSEFDLGADNHRSSAASGILAVADAVLANKAPIPSTTDVSFWRYQAAQFALRVHLSVVSALNTLRKKKGIVRPSLAVLCRTNTLVMDISTLLNEERPHGSGKLPVLDHHVVWDADLAATSAAVVGSILEWPAMKPQEAVVWTLRYVVDFYRLKNAAEPSKSATEAAAKYAKAQHGLKEGRSVTLKAVKALLARAEVGVSLVGDPVQDWKRAWEPLREVSAFNEIYREARMVRLFRATDALASGLADQWRTHGSYKGASEFVKRVLDRERLIAADREPDGCVLMTMHKAKAKEFDGVVMVEGMHKSPFFDSREKAPHPHSRRLLRVGITRAKSYVIVVQPYGAPPLVG